jgi:hypothetical protein
VVGSASPRARKRQRVDDDEGGEDAMDVEPDIVASTVVSPPVWRGVELETTVERFLLRMYDAGPEAADVDAETETGGANVTGGDPEGGAEKEDKQEQLQQQQGEGDGDRRRWEIWLLGTLDRNDGMPQARLLPPPGVTDVDGNGNAAGATKMEAGGAVMLQRGLRVSNLEFVEGEVRVLQDAVAAPATTTDSESSCAAREGWAIEVRRWRWARS